MSAIQQNLITPLITPQDYLAKERLAEFKSEYYRGEVFAMSGASYPHTLIKDNFAREYGNQFKDGPCAVLTTAGSSRRTRS